MIVPKLVRHHTSNVSVRLNPHSTASMSAYVLSLSDGVEGGFVATVATYSDELVNEGAWLIIHRVIEVHARHRVDRAD